MKALVFDGTGDAANMRFQFLYFALWQRLVGLTQLLAAFEAVSVEVPDPRAGSVPRMILQETTLQVPDAAIADLLDAVRAVPWSVDRSTEVEDVLRFLKGAPPA